MNIGFSFATLQALGKTPREIDRLQRAETGFARMSAPSFKNLPESRTRTELRLYLSAGFGSFIRKDSAKFEKKFFKIFEMELVSRVKVLTYSIALKLEITVLFEIPRDPRDSHNSLGLPIDSERFSLKGVCFFVVINFEAS